MKIKKLPPGAHAVRCRACGKMTGYHQTYDKLCKPHDDICRACYRLVASMAYNLLEQAVEQWAGRFETEEDINGADAVDWLSEFIEEAQAIVERKGGDS